MRTGAAVPGVTVLGIDPGSQCLGWGVVREESGVLRLLGCGTIRPKSEVFEQRLGEIFSALTAVIRQYAPDEAAVENVFVQKNVISALKLGQARGAAIAACAAAELPVIGYEPALIKKSLVGNGRAEKSQVSFMVGRILNVKPTWAVDAGDALGCAVCHCNMRRMQRLAGM
ncbi:component of RuvABC resolvasome, endonuclease [uncultured delta proteobacterium]|uniref:Crossover junction endodeoxyribonuclease RuvC n=1 Tax=uncultured delta proteobacterium TaxID=34034 RepID=A0A212IZ91_9DELT|nr:component of RuvABC resolvasome, endonuclease [uncultured delta proteobacterium]